VIALLLGRCRACEYEATVGIGVDEGTTVPVLWAPALCRSCGLVSVNMASGSSVVFCHECDEPVTLYTDDGSVPVPSEGWPCPDCREPALGFRLVR
jgi:hypothetical protein